MAAAGVAKAMEAVPAFQVYRRLLNELLESAAQIRSTADVGLPLTEAQFKGAVKNAFATADKELSGCSAQAHRDAVETVFREIFYSFLATTPIDSPEIVRMWNLFDLAYIFSDNGRAEPPLFFWLAEELLDSQTIVGCRKVFDYLESRREQTVTKAFSSKSLAILRPCNELLRRLSRAEDTVFCGRVFIYLFQSFPLGDKSSVNLRGEYHTENVTTFEDTKDKDAMNVDEPEGKPVEQKTDGDSEQSTTTKSEGQISSNATEKPKEPLSMDEIYPIFWSLQAFFSAPTKLFDASTLQKFKTGLEETLAMFRRVETDVEVQNIAKPPEDQRRGAKRRRIGDGGIEVTNTFNPKYLTSRDLFELEINDVAFRRHILVQALIILDFLLSLTPAAKEKLSHATNKSVLYSFTLNDEDSAWMNRMKNSISRYLQDGPDGKFYYRMVDTVLTRDKNWVRWKAEGCPKIESPPVSTSDYLETRTKATKMFAPKRLRATPMGSLDLKFLAKESSESAMNKLKESERYTNPNPETYFGGIADDEFDIDTAASTEEKDQATKAKYSKIWRILRLTSRTHLNRFKDIDDGNNLKILFQPQTSHDQQPSSSSKAPSESKHTDSTPPESATTKDEQSHDDLPMRDKEQNLAVQQG
ncbi:hypothetical protein KEM56_006041 [Ascosphaera pollenicola]|nr:hypothetical protein KEM56_006041 [Ascosphaera pollenicola]